MRPLELSLEGFRSYRSPTTFDFQDRGLFAIVGPTGAGKSSILDAIIYGLYGRTPQIGNDTKKLITSGAGIARVRLVFEVDGSTWEVTRVLRNAGASQNVLHRQGEVAFEASGERAVNQRIVDIVGLDFDAFCSSVTLPQGEFDRFLKATPSDRSKILKRIFRYERVDSMKEAAKRRVNDADIELKAVQGELSALPPEPEALLASLQEQLEEREERVTALKDAAAGFAAAQSVVALAEERLDEIRSRAELTARTLAKIPPADGLEALAAEEDAGLGSVAQAEAALEAAQQAAGDAAAGAAQAEAAFGGERLALAKTLVVQRRRVSDQASSRAASLATMRKAAEESRAALEAQTATTGAAETAAHAAEDELRRTRQAHAAHLLRADLKPGEPCPVCAQDVAEVPPLGAVPVALGAAQQAADAAARHLKAVQKRLTELHGATSSAGAKLQAAEEEMASATRELAEIDEELAALLGPLGPGAGAAAEVHRREAVVAAATRHAELCRKRAEASLQAVTVARAGLEASAKKRRHILGELIRIATILGLEPPDTEDDAASLAGAAKLARDAGAATLAEQARLREEVLAQQAESRVVVAGLAERLLLDARTVEIQARRSLYQRLATDFTDAKFIAYLLDADRQRLARVGSEKLFQLTGRYRFDDEGQFHLLDLANDVVRSPDTLSGGETFLASLALALALAEAVSEGGSRLDCFFLDEGFGSLDAASLDLALDGVESLALPGRLIGVISHVGGVQARLDDLIVLEKARDGSTVVLQTEGPLAYQPGAI